MADRRPDKPKTLLVFSQTFVPDPAAVGQQIADVTVEMARRGHRVIVYTANRGYEDPTARYPDRELRGGVEIRRLRWSSFGKRRIFTRIVGTASFLVQCLLLALFLPDVDAIFFSTSPPMIGLAAAAARWFRRIPIIYWAMDLNPDQLIAMGRISPHGPAAQVLERVNRYILRSASLVIALDRFMAQRLSARVPLAGKMLVMPPWPHEDCLGPLDHAANPFRAKHGLEGKFVVMYSGNHSPSNPLDTILEAALRLRNDRDIRFLFVGGGTGKKDVEAFVRQHHLTNVQLLGYQPLADIRYSLSAADVHVVSLGDPMVGIIHPCKVYGAMAIARPVLFLGPKPSHIADLLTEHQFGLHVSHGDVDAAVRAIQGLKEMSPQERSSMGAVGQAMLQEKLGQERLCHRLCDHVERVMAGGVFTELCRVIRVIRSQFADPPLRRQPLGTTPSAAHQGIRVA